MIMLTKEQLADLLRQGFEKGARACAWSLNREDWIDSEAYHDARERAIQRLIHRSSGGHDDHGREVK